MHLKYNITHAYITTDIRLQTDYKFLVEPYKVVYHIYQTQSPLTHVAYNPTRYLVTKKAIDLRPMGWTVMFY